MSQSTPAISMQNILNKIDIYRSKSIMTMEAGVSVNYNAATPMVQFKFASRPDAKSAGNWNNNQNAYWFPSFGSLVDAVTQCTALLTATANNDTAIAKFSNPKKQKYLQVRKNLGDNQEIWYVFSYMSGSQDAGDQIKINCSCTQPEFNSILGFLKNMLTQFPTIAQMALMRYDNWYNLVGKFKNESAGGYNSNQQNGSGNTGGYNPTSSKNTGGYAQNSKPANQNNGYAPSNSGHSNPADAAMNDLQNQYGGGSGAGDFSEDIPF